MPKTITQKIRFSNVHASVLYELYMDAKKHSASTGAKAVISNKPGAKFTAHDGYISGKNVWLEKNKTIVQSWRGSDWSKKDPDSVFIIHIETDRKDSVLHITHANLPDKHARDIAKGWHEYYWKMWKSYLDLNKVRK